MAGKSKNEKDRKKSAVTSSKKTGSTSLNSKTKSTPKKKAQATAAKAKPTKAKSKSPKRTEPELSAKAMKGLEKLAQKYGGGQDNPNVKPTSKVNVSKSGETKVAPYRNAKVKEVTVKYKFE